jgi:hypothetical protein
MAIAVYAKIGILFLQKGSEMKYCIARIWENNGYPLEEFKFKTSLC